MRDDLYTAAVNDPFTENEPAEINPFKATLLRLLRGRWHWAILLAVPLGVAGGYLAYNSLAPAYQADSGVTIKANYGVAVDIKDLSQYEPYVNTYLNEISRIEANETIEIAMEQPAWVDAMKLYPEYADMSIGSFRGELEVYPPERNEQTITLKFSSEAPEVAQAGLNSLLDAYEIVQKRGESDNIGNNLEILESRLRDLEKREILTREQMRLVIPDNEYLMIKRRLGGKLGELTSMEFKLNDIDIVLQPFLDPENEGAALSQRELMLQDPNMVELLEQKKALEDEYIYQTEVLGRGETMISVVQVKRLISRVDRQILDLESTWLNQSNDGEVPMPPKVAELMGQRKALLNKIAEIQAETTDMATRLSEVEEEEYELDQIRESMRAVQDEIARFNDTTLILQDNEELTRIEIGSKASVPSSPMNANKRIQVAVAGSLGGIFLGFGLVMGVGLLDRRLRHVADTASDIPDTNVLGILPTLPADLKDPEEAEAAAHCVHHIRTLLQIGGSNRVFSITSPEAGSGKSSLATALGMSFATAGSRTLVIDADLVGAGISRRMGAVVHESLEAVIRHNGMVDEADLARAQTTATSQDTTLEEVLLRESLMSQEQVETAQRLQRDTSLGLLNACAPGQLRSCVASTGINNFYVLPVGKARPSDASRLSPAAMRELVRQAREAFDIVLIDTGPVLGSLEASIAAAESDSTVMIVSRGDQRSIATRSIDQLRSVRANIAGLVFNHALESDLMHTSYASIISQERRPDLGARKRKLDKTRSARLGPLGTAVASYSDDDSDTGESLLDVSNGDRNGHGVG